MYKSRPANLDQLAEHIHLLEADEAAFETDITRYKELQQDIQSEEGITNVGFIRIDSSPLKQSLVAHCHTWQTKFTQLLNNNAATELRGLYDHMESVQKVCWGEGEG